MKVLTIVGFGGLGKTTLAKEVYHEIDEQFDVMAFVSVSQRPDIRKLLHGIQLELEMRKSPVTNGRGEGETELSVCIELGPLGNIYRVQER